MPRGQVEETENTIRIALREDKEFDDFRTIRVTSGVQLLLGIEGNSSEPVTLIFDKDQFTRKEAENWFDEHKEDFKEKIKEVIDMERQKDELFDKENSLYNQETMQDEEKLDELDFTEQALGTFVADIYGVPASDVMDFLGQIGEPSFDLNQLAIFIGDITQERPGEVLEVLAAMAKGEFFSDDNATKGEEKYSTVEKIDKELKRRKD